MIMLMSVSGHYDGHHIVLDRDAGWAAGQKVTVTLAQTEKSSARRKLDWDKYIGRGPKLFDGDAQDFIRELRDFDIG